MKFATSLILCFLSLSSACAQSFLGWWRGEVVGLPIVFHISEDDDSSLSGWLYSPAQTSDSIAVDHIEANGGNIILRISALGAIFSGRFNDAPSPSIQGTFFQGREFPVTLYPATKDDASVYRPQTPQPPFVYVSRDVEFRNESLTFAATLTSPGYTSPRGGVVLVSGSGSQNRDEEILGHKPFAVIADYLTKRGWAVLRYDDRGVGGSSPGSPDDTTVDFASDAMAAVSYMRSLPMLAGKPVGLLGHSEGGTIALMCAADFPDSVNFAISLAGAMLAGADVMVRQNEMLAELQGTPLSDAQMHDVRAAFDAIVNISDRDSLSSRLDSLMATTIPDPAIRRANIAAMTSPWYVAFVRLNPEPYLRRLRVPFMALGGSYDVQVDAIQNLDIVRRLLPSADVRLYDGLNHLFQESPNRASSFSYGSISQTISPLVLEDIYKFLDGVAK